jgi:hypothetical protein
LEFDPMIRWIESSAVEGRAMRVLIVVLTSSLSFSSFFGAAWAQGTKDPSNPVPTMVFPIRPRDEPTETRPTAVPNRTFPSQPPIQVRPAYRYRIYRHRHRHRHRHR